MVYFMEDSFWHGWWLGVPSFWGNSLEDLGQSGCDIGPGWCPQKTRSWSLSVSYWVSRGQDINTGETPAPFCQRRDIWIGRVWWSLPELKILPHSSHPRLFWDDCWIHHEFSQVSHWCKWISSSKPNAMLYVNVCIHYWLVVWNHGILWLSIYWES